VKEINIRFTGGMLSITPKRIRSGMGTMPLEPREWKSLSLLALHAGDVVRHTCFRKALSFSHMEKTEQRWRTSHIVREMRWKLHTLTNSCIDIRSVYGEGYRLLIR
jgi:DNA-binding response OmpR family regulator